MAAVASIEYCLICPISRMPVDKAPKRQAWTAQQKWFAVELKRKFPDKKLDTYCCQG
jgi:hypothetical protein